MSSIIIAVALSHFLAGLALFTLAGMTGTALGRAAGRRAVAWGLLATTALGLAEWCDLAVGRLARPAVWQMTRLGLEMVALVGLIELGRLCMTGRRAGLLPRLSYPLIAGLSATAILFKQPGPLEFALRLVICWQAGWLAANFFSRGKTSTLDRAAGTTIVASYSSTLAARAIVGGLFVYLLAACAAVPLTAVVAITPYGPSPVAAGAGFGGPLAYLLAACSAIPLPGMLAALVALAAAYLAFGKQFEQNRGAGRRWHCVWPIGFVLVAACGCFVLAAACAAENERQLAEMVKAAAGAVADSDQAGDAGDDDSADADATAGDGHTAAALDRLAKAKNIAADATVVRQAKRLGLGLSPIVIFVLVIWGLSRLPFVH